MIRTNLLNETKARKIAARKGNFYVMEYDHDISVSPEDAMVAYYASQMNVRKRQVIAELEDSGIIVQSGAMQLMIGDVAAATNIKDPGDLMKKFMNSKITGETTIRPQYRGNGIIMLEPTYKFIILEDLADWNGAMIIEDGMFLACSSTINMKLTARNTVSSAVLGEEGFFNNALVGEGIVALESPVPRDELIVVDLQDDVLKIDGNMAIAWSKSLKFTVEKTTKTLVGSSASGEKLVNTYRGTGRVLIAPVEKNKGITVPDTKEVM